MDHAVAPLTRTPLYVVRGCFSDTVGLNPRVRSSSSTPSRKAAHVVEYSTLPLLADTVPSVSSSPRSRSIRCSTLARRYAGGMCLLLRTPNSRNLAYALSFSRMGGTASSGFPYLRRMALRLLMRLHSAQPPALFLPTTRRSWPLTHKCASLRRSTCRVRVPSPEISTLWPAASIEATMPGASCSDTVIHAEALLPSPSQAPST